MLIEVWEAYTEASNTTCIISRTKELAEKYGQELFGMYFQYVGKATVSMNEVEIKEMDTNGYYYCNT